MTAPAISRISDKARTSSIAVRTALRDVSRARLASAVVGITALVAVALLVPLPTAVQIRDWAQATGPWLPLTFWLVHATVTVLPFPRTAFTLAAGLLFGPVTGVLIASTASTTSAVLALLAVRATGWRLNRLEHRPGVSLVNERLRERGWRAILSLRFIPVIPFSVINYAAGTSDVRVAPYMWATLAGHLPGTIAVVILGNAFTGDVNPLLVLISVCTAALGLSGLVYEIRHVAARSGHRPQPVPDPAPTASSPAA
ncbi:TVP38/TMEM64 family protein [Mycobacterium sp.]|uniref:TVP38/TMEM64 family protein n=1 Tax=Mycobacterium sp. TaxID=1785 RepID=UPI003A84D1A2